MINRLLAPILSRIHLGNRAERIWKIAQLDFKKRYYNSTLGLFWALLNPLFRIGIYYYVFTVFFTRPVDNFALYLFSGLIFWMFFKESSSKGIKTITKNRYLIESIQFDSIDLFYSGGISTLLGFLFNLSAYLLLAVCLGISFGYNLLLLPVLIINVSIIGIATGLILSTINIFFKDIRYFWDMVTLLGFWTCPIFFRGQAVLEKAPALLYLNPISGIIINSRPILLTDDPINWFWIIYDMAFALVLFVLAVKIFKAFSHRAVEMM